MPALDRDHEIVKAALEKDGWTITHDPMTLKYKDSKLFVDLGAEKLIVAERGNTKIAVEVKTFSGYSEMTDLHRATGQYVLYETVLQTTEPERQMILAVPDDVLRSLFKNDIGELLIQNGTLRIVGYDPQAGVLTQWLPPILTDAS